MNNIFAERLKKAMEQKNMKQIDLVKKAAEQGVKLGKSHVSQYLSGKTTPRSEILNFLATTLGVETEWLKGTDVSVDTLKKGMVMALAECVGIEYARFLILLNLGFFVIEIIWGRKLIGLGTIINALFLGYFVTFFYNLITSVIDAPDQMAMQVVTVFIGVIITSLGISMYQLPKQGVAPYDSISLIMTEKWPKIPYFWCRVSNDAISALVCWLAGGIVGLGTLVSAFGFGPFVQFFDTHFTSKVLAKLEK